MARLIAVLHPLQVSFQLWLILLLNASILTSASSMSTASSNDLNTTVNKLNHTTTSISTTSTVYSTNGSTAWTKLNTTILMQSSLAQVLTSHASPYQALPIATTSILPAVDTSQKALGYSTSSYQTKSHSSVNEPQAEQSITLTPSISPINATTTNVNNTAGSKAMTHASDSSTNNAFSTQTLTHLGERSTNFHNIVGSETLTRVDQHSSSVYSVDMSKASTQDIASRTDNIVMSTTLTHAGENRSENEHIQSSLNSTPAYSDGQVGSVYHTKIPSNINSSNTISKSTVERTLLNSSEFLASNIQATTSIARVGEAMEGNTSVFASASSNIPANETVLQTTILPSALAFLMMTSLNGSLSDAISSTPTMHASNASISPTQSQNFTRFMSTKPPGIPGNATIAATTKALNAKITNSTAVMLNSRSKGNSASTTMISTHSSTAVVDRQTFSKSLEPTSTLVSQPMLSSSITLTTPVPFLRQDHMIYLLSAVLINETFYQDLANKASGNFSLLAKKLHTELKLRLNSSSGFIKTDVLNFTNHKNGVAFTSEVYYNSSANMTAFTLQTRLEQQAASGLEIANISVQEMCSTVSCNNHGSCARLSSEVDCKCNKGFTGYRCQRSYPVDGNYSQWSAYDSCSKSCGEGMQVRRRTCTNPAPIHGGKDCSGIGIDQQSRVCSLQECVIEDWVIWIIVGAVCFIILFVIILGCCFLRKAKYYYKSYGMSNDGRKYKFTENAFSNEAYESQLAEFRTESTVVPLKVIKEDPFKNAYANSDTIAEPRKGKTNSVYQRELKTFLNNAHQLRGKDANDRQADAEEGEYIEPEVNFHQTKPGSAANPGGSPSTGRNANT